MNPLLNAITSLFAAPAFATVFLQSFALANDVDDRGLDIRRLVQVGGFHVPAGVENRVDCAHVVLGVACCWMLTR